MPERILITGTVGDCLPPPYAGIPKLSLFTARRWREEGNQVAITFIYRQKREDDLGAGGEYFFEYDSAPNKIKKTFFLIKFFLKNPKLYLELFIRYLKIDRHLTKEAILYPAYGVFLDGIFKAFKPTVVLAEAALIKTYMAAEIARRHKVPIVYDTYAEIHDLSIGIGSLLNEKELKTYWKDFLEKASLVISPSLYCAQGPLKYLPENKVKVVYPGIDIKICQSAINEDPKKLREKFQLPENDFLTIAVGAFTPRKGHDHLIKAVARLRKAGHPIGVILCGPGKQEKWRELAKTEGIADCVYFFSGLSETELYQLYKSADVYCDASNTPRACLGMSLTEAMALSLPAIAYNNGGLPEIVKENKNGILVKTDDIPALSEAILKMYKLNSEERKRMGEAGRAMAEELVDLEKFAKRKLELLISLNK